MDDTFGDGGPVGWDDYGFGQATVADGVNLIAGGIENVLQRFRLQVPSPACLPNNSLCRHSPLHHQCRAVL